LGLNFHKSVSIGTAIGKTSRRIFRGANIELNERSFVMDIRENDDETPAIVGYLLLEALDFIIAPKIQKVIQNPAHEGSFLADLY
jgi:hypothetical protein